MVVQWTHLISDVLRLDSAQLILQGENPGPSAEIQFWQQQKENLLGIYEQLQNPKVHKVTEILNRKRSSYYPGFKQLTLKVEEAVSEAQDICLYLGPLKCYIAYLEESSFSNIERLIAPLFHTICLIWTHSKYYCFANRIVVLLQEFCNLLIDRAFSFLIPEEIFTMDLEEGMEKIKQTIQTFRMFKNTFSTCQEKLACDRRNDHSVKQWDFPSHLVFSRMDKILRRLLHIEELFTSATDFLKLEKIEIGGLRGRIFSEDIHCMNEEFHESWKVLQESKYDPLDYNNLEFLSDYKRYIQQINDFDNRLGTILNFAFQEPKGLESVFKNLQTRTCFTGRFLDSVPMGSFLSFIAGFTYGVLTVHHHNSFCLFKLRDGGNALHKNMPVTAGNLKWSQELRERLLKHRTHFKRINHLILQTEETNFVFQKCEKMLELLDKHDEEIYTTWAQDLSHLCETHLGQPILRYNDCGLFEVNFNEKVK
uniref:Dynein heavy chain tail domain-containing protein n=1 Tax=Podarcis muralis TaxID=64176 RepID=A0A670HLE4_PODMU